MAQALPLPSVTNITKPISSHRNQYLLLVIIISSQNISYRHTIITSQTFIPFLVRLLLEINICKR